jgi:putative heme iron utilization protein
MTVDNPAPAGPPDAPAVVARRLVRSSLKASLASLGRDSGHPYASLVLAATEPDGSPVLVISRLAVHTQNLARDARASLLFDGSGEMADPLSGPRVTLIGTVQPASTPTALRRFVARHPAAQTYASFADFAAYSLVIESAHYIGGFGRIVGLAAADLTTSVAGAEALVAAEADIVSHMNEDHADAIALYATMLAGQPPGDWRMTGIDPAGMDLLHRTTPARVDFPSQVHTPQEARAVLVALAQEARSGKARPT